MHFRRGAVELRFSVVEKATSELYHPTTCPDPRPQSPPSLIPCNNFHLPFSFLLSFPVPSFSMAPKRSNASTPQSSRKPASSSSTTSSSTLPSTAATTTPSSPTQATTVTPSTYKQRTTGSTSLPPSAPVADVLMHAWDAYVAQTPARTQLLDTFLAFLVAVGALQFAYCVVAGNYVSCVPFFFAVVCLGMGTRERGNAVVEMEWVMMERKGRKRRSGWTCRSRKRRRRRARAVMESGRGGRLGAWGCGGGGPI